MSRTLMIYWMGALLFATMLGVSNAWADCQWEVSGTLEGEQPGFNGQPPTIWTLSGREIRVQARWANMACPQIGFNSVECPWTTVGWSTDTTDSQGDFTVQSVPFPDPVCQKGRDFRVEVRGYPVTSWTVAAQVDDISGPNGFQGPQIPMATHTTSLRTVRTDVYAAPTEVIWDESEGEEDKEDREPRLERADNFPPSRRGGDNPTPRIEAVPCGLETRSLGTSTEFRFGAMNTTGSNVSFDGALMIETRATSAGRMTLNRLTAHILVENAGNRNFSYSEHCPAKVTVRINEGPGERNGDPWQEQVGNMPNVPANTEVPHEQNANLLGAGDDYADEPWEHDWEYALIEVVLDSGNDVIESAEGDNVVQHCYHAPSNSFTNMSSCSTR